MKKKAVLVFCISAAAGLVLFFASLGDGFGQGRPRTVDNQSLTKKQALVVPAPSGPLTPAAMAAKLADAATQNIDFKTNLEWLFGGKQQHGWFLYQPLISRLIGSTFDSSSPEFAKAVLGWQQKNALYPSGIIDSDTLYKMVESWQDVRSQDHTYASPEDLITAPPSDFLFPERPAELRQVEKTTYAAYKKMLAAAAADPTLKLNVTSTGELAASERYFRIISAFRSHEYQAELRRRSPNVGRAGLALNSPHFTGRALDIYVGGDPVDTADANRALQVKTPVYQWLVANAEKFGFYPYYYEPWHWEYKPKS